MGFAARDELLPALNELLEAERAGARVTLAAAKEIGDDALEPLILAIHRDEARWCGVLTRADPSASGRAIAEDGRVLRQGDGDPRSSGAARLPQSRSGLGGAQTEGAAADHPG